MKRTQIFLAIIGMFMTAVFLSSCGNSQVPATQSEVPRMTVKELKERLDDGDEILVADTRNKTAYNFKRLPGAISIPQDQAEAHVQGIASGQEIVLYCDCPSEIESAAVALIMYELGFENVSALRGGIDSWEAEGFPMENP